MHFKQNNRTCRLWCITLVDFLLHTKYDYTISQCVRLVSLSRYELQYIFRVMWINVQKTSQFKTQCKGDIRYASKTAKLSVFDLVICKNPGAFLQDELRYWTLFCSVW